MGVPASPSTARSFSAWTDQLFASVIPSCFRFRHRIGAGSFSPLDTSKNLIGCLSDVDEWRCWVAANSTLAPHPIGRARSDLRLLRLSMAGLCLPKIPFSCFHQCNIVTLRSKLATISICQEQVLLDPLRKQVEEIAAKRQKPGERLET